MREHTGNKINIGTPPKKEGVGNKIKQDQKLHEQINNSVNQIIDLKKTEIQPTNIKTHEEVTQHIAIENKDTSTQGSAWRNYHSNSTFITTNTETIHECNEITKENSYLASKSKEGMYNTCFMVDYATNTEIAEYSAHFLFTINELEEKAKSEREKFTSERLIILTQMKDHQMRIKKLEEELQTYSAKVKNLDDILNEDQDSCKKKAVNLEKQLETLTFLFHQLTNNTSSLKTEKQILEKKLEIKQIQLKECEEQNSNMRQQLSKKMLLIEEYKDRLGVDKIMKDKALNNQNVQIIKTILGGKKNKGTFENIEANPGEPGI
jgi:chromosome segregation ATPase